MVFNFVHENILKKENPFQQNNNEIYWKTEYKKE